MSGRSLGIAIVLQLAASIAAAQSPDEERRAVAHYDAGRALYGLGNYEDALREFASGYQLSHKPAFLINLGHAYQKLGQAAKAREMYAQFLVEASPSDTRRIAVQQILATLDATAAAHPPARAAPIAAAPPTQPERAAPSRVRHLGWIVPLVGVLIAGAVVGAWFGARAASRFDCGSVSLGCVDGSGLR